MPIGIHLSLTLGKAAAPISEVPELVDEKGYLNLSAKRLLLIPLRVLVASSCSPKFNGNSRRSLRVLTTAVCGRHTQTRTNMCI